MAIVAYKCMYIYNLYGQSNLLSLKIYCWYFPLQLSVGYIGLCKCFFNFFLRSAFETLGKNIGSVEVKHLKLISIQFNESFAALRDSTNELKSTFFFNVSHFKKIRQFLNGNWSASRSLLIPLRSQWMLLTKIDGKVFFTEILLYRT